MADASTVAQLIEESRLNPLRWWIPGVLMQHGVHILHGKEECFKSMLTLQMAEALSAGGEFLMRPVERGIRTGIVQLEEKPTVFGHRLERFFPHNPPDIRVLPSSLRSEVLRGRTPEQRIGLIVGWAKDQGLEVTAIDSAVKLFPPNFDPSKPEKASDVFNQLQRLPTPWILAHDRKSQPGAPASTGNDEIVGSGRFAQDPDVVHFLHRDDKRSPKTVFEWGKVRDGEKSPPLELWFDRENFRLRPLHPYLHLLQAGPMSEGELITEADKRYGWRERRAREFVATLQQLKDSEGRTVIATRSEGHRKILELVGVPIALDPET